MTARTIAEINHNDEDRRVSLILFSNHQEDWYWVECEGNVLFDCKGYHDAIAKIERIYGSDVWGLEICDDDE